MTCEACDGGGWDPDFDCREADTAAPCAKCEPIARLAVDRFNAEVRVHSAPARLDVRLGRRWKRGLTWGEALLELHGFAIAREAAKAHRATAIARHRTGARARDGSRLFNMATGRFER